MDPFDCLVKIARNRRDKALREARNEFRLACEQIEQLRNILDCPRVASSRAAGKFVLDAIRKFLPTDHAFTAQEVCAIMRDNQPGREFKITAMRNYLPKLEAVGYIRKVCRNNSRQVVWAVAELAVEKTVFGAMPATEVADLVLSERGPLKLAELVHEMQARGYRPHVKPHRIARALRTSRDNRNRYVVGEDGRWAIS